MLFIFSPTNITSLQQQYAASQYCLSAYYQTQHHWDKLTPSYTNYCSSSHEFKGNIDDPQLYTLAGYYYIKGADPTAINPESQPLTKYLFGLSLLLFGNPLFIEYLSLVCLLVLLYLFARPFLTFPWTLLPLILFSTDKLVLQQLHFAYLDLATTAFILFYLYAVWRHSRLVPILLGLVALAKSFSLGILATIVTMVYLYLTRKSKLKDFVLHLWITILVYLLGYFMFFVHGHNLIDFVRLHLNTLRLYRSYVPEYPKGEIFRLIFTNRWRQWYGSFALIPVSEWTFLWPFTLIASFLTLLVKQLRTKPIVLLHLIWIIVYFAFISLRLVFPRYLLPVLPSLYLLSTIFISHLFFIFKTNN